MKCGLSVRRAVHGGEETRRKRGWPVKHVVVNRLRELRQEAGLTQDQLAADLDVTRHTVLALEDGRYMPPIELALRLTAYFNRPLESIFCLDPHQDHPIRGQVPVPAPS